MEKVQQTTTLSKAWQYTFDTFFKIDADALQEMNLRGKQGWELVSVTYSSDNNNYVVMYKRLYD